MSRARYLEEAAKLIDGRVAALVAELGDAEPSIRNASDRAAIFEAKLLARLIRNLALTSSRNKSPYAAAKAWRDCHGDTP